MSSDLVTIGSNTASLATTGAVGSSIFRQSRFFRLKPMKISLTQAQTRREGNIPGKFYNEMTNEYFDKMRVVMLVEPREARTKYVKGAPYGSSPECFSTDGIKPHDNAQSPQALNCKNCRHSDWSKYKKSKRSEDLPPCKNRFIIYALDREVQLPYEIDVHGQSISPFFSQMQHIGGLAEKYRAKHGSYPELFYFSFEISIKTKISDNGVNYVMVFSDTRLMEEETRKEFGELLAEFQAYKNRQLRDEKEEEAESEIEGEFSEAGGSTDFTPGDMQQGEVEI